jgi:2-polyprenyl-3-methyl-5-hydroxy-6-metoxy-1,4-benzoquinol methylase
MNGEMSANCSAAGTAFDGIAKSYDELFTRTAIGRAQRAQVWNELVSAFPEGARILELNCGTGEDARFLAQRGRSVVACDASVEMIRVAQNSTESAAMSAAIEYLQIANEDLGLLATKEPFDGAFSNFSGLNCLADLKPVARNLAGLVRPGGRVLICLWSRICLGEIAWFLVRGQVKKAFRRFMGKATARLGGETIAVAYPMISCVREMFEPWFRLETRRAIGLFVPPSYVESWARRNMRALAQLEKLDRVFADWRILRDIGDHVLLEFVRCQA